jgi:hypothetical protein
VSELDGIIVRPKVHEEQARPFIKHVTVQGRNFDTHAIILLLSLHAP